MINITLNHLKEEERTKLKFYVQFYEISSIDLHKLSHRQEITKTIDKYQYFIEMADSLGNRDAIKWARERLQILMTIKIQSNWYIYTLSNKYPPSKKQKNRIISFLVQHQTNKKLLTIVNQVLEEELKPLRIFSSFKGQ